MAPLAAGVELDLSAHSGELLGVLLPQARSAKEPLRWAPAAADLVFAGLWGLKLVCSTSAVLERMNGINHIMGTASLLEQLGCGELEE